MSLVTGAHQEVRALRWDHVHLEAIQMGSTLVPPHVEVSRLARSSGDTKTRRSRRTLAMPTRCIEALRDERDRQERERLREEQAGRSPIWSSPARSVLR